MDDIDPEMLKNLELLEEMDLLEQEVHWETIRRSDGPSEGETQNDAS